MTINNTQDKHVKADIQQQKYGTNNNPFLLWMLHMLHNARHQFHYLLICP